MTNTNTDARDIRNPLTIAPHADDHTCDYQAHASIRAARWSLNVANGGFTITAPASAASVAGFARGQHLSATGEIMISLKNVDDVIALLPQGEIVRVHMSACDEIKAKRALLSIERAGWSVRAVAWNRTIKIGTRDARDAYMGFMK